MPSRARPGAPRFPTAVLPACAGSGGPLVPPFWSWGRGGTPPQRSPRRTQHTSTLLVSVTPRTEPATSPFLWTFCCPLSQRRDREGFRAPPTTTTWRQVRRAPREAKACKSGAGQCLPALRRLGEGGRSVPIVPPMGRPDSAPGTALRPLQCPQFGVAWWPGCPGGPVPPALLAGGLGDGSCGAGCWVLGARGSC